MDSVCLQERPADLRRDFPRTRAANGIARLVAVCAFLFAGVAAPAHAQNFKVGNFTKPAGTAVTYQSAASVSVNSSTTVTIAGFNPGAGSNRLLVVGLSSSATLPSLTVRYGGVDLTLVPGTSGTNGATHTEMWYLVNPSSTAADIVATWTGTRAVVMGAVAFNNVDQMVPIQNGTFATGTSKAPSVTVTSGAGDMTMAIAAKITDLGAATQTSRWLDTSRANIKGSGSTAAGAATVTHGWAASGATSTVWTAAGVSIKQAGGQATVVAHGLGQTPSALILWTSGSTTGTGFANSDWSAFGMSDGTTSYSTSRSSRDGVATPSASRRAAQKALTIVQYGQMLLAEADLTSWDATNIDLAWSSNNATASVIHYMAISGVSAKLLNWKPTAGTGNKSVTGFGFQPNVVFHLEDFDSAALPSSVADAAFMLGVMDSDGKQWATAVNSTSGTAPSNTARAQRTDACIEEITGGGTEQTRANWVSMDADGFTVNYTLNGAQNNVYSLALAGLNLQAGSFTKMTVGGTPAFVQQAAKNAGAVASTTQAFPGASTAGNLIIATVSFDSAAQTVQSISDNRGNTYTLAVGPTSWGPNYRTYTYYASNIAAGATTITATLTGAPASFFELYQLEYSGVSTVSPLDQVSAASGNSTVWNSGPTTTTQVNELIYGYGAGQSGTAAKGATFTSRSTFDSNIAEDKNVQAIGSYSADGTFPGATAWVAQMATFKGNLQSFTGLGFQPSAVLLSSFQDITRAAPVAHARVGIGASDGTTEGTTAIQDTDALATTRVQNFDKTTKVFAKIDNNTSTIEAEADLLSLDADGFTLNWTTNDAVATEMLYVAFGPMWLTEVRLISFTAAKYDSGVLLQWRTGYEIDNLGFNLYREIDGVRAPVNTSLIAGSGLQAGQGGVVTTEHNYARWDLHADASDPTVTYWLEDVEFNGKSKWHGPVTPVVSQLQEPSTPDSAELGDIGNATNSRRIFFNYNDDPLQPGPRVGPAQVQPEVTTQWTLAAQATVKMGIRKPGWYRVTQPELVDAGLDSQVDPHTLQLFVDGTEQAIRVTGETDSSFDPADAIEFYGSGIETPHTDTRTYWLQAGAQPGRRIEVDAGGSSAPSTLTGFSSTLRRKDRSVYFAALRNGDAENWFGPMVFPDPPVPDPDYPGSPTLTLTPNKIDRLAPGPAQLTVTLQGVTTTPDGSSNHRIGVLVNGTDVGEMTFAGQAHAEQTFAVPVRMLIDGANTVTLVAGGASEDTSLVDAIRLDYPHTYQADADRLRLTVEGPGSITIGGFASASIRVFDITDRTAPVELPGAVVADAGLSTVTVHVPGTGPRTLMAFSDETVASPAFVRANQPSNWHTSGNASDYVLISHADFITQVRPLAALREQQGHRAAVVDVEDVYDEFSFGEKTPQAIRDFLQWARTNWATAPKFVVLAGDATIDPRDYEGLGNADFVPTKQVPMNQVALETASDDWFVDFSGNGLSEIAIGRLSVRTAAQADTMVAKIVGYDQAPPQPWSKDVLLVADQNDATSDFERSSNNLSALLPQDYTAHTVFRGALGDAAAHQAIVDRVNEGQLIVNYTGHGSTGIWGGSGELLTSADVTGSWTNAAKLPFVVAMNCLNGLFNGIYGEESLAETLVRAPNGGAVAAWASSSLTPSATQSLVNQELFRLIFQGTYATVGEAVAAAKRVVSNQDLRRSWIFFGDPAMRLIGAPQPVSTNPPVITTQPLGTTIASGQQAVVNVVVTGSAPLTYQWYVGASGQTTNPIAGATSSTFTQAVTNTTSYWVRVSNPYGTADSSVAMMSAPLAITTANPWPTVTAGIAYDLTLAATDSTPPYQWDATTLPSGLTLNPATGDIAGTPNGAGTFSVDIRVTDGDAVWAQQTFSLTVEAATDALIDQQWHLKDRAVEVAAANVEPAWAATRGAGVVIGIVDHGLQSTHPDLQANYLASLSYDFSDHDTDPSPDTVGSCGTANCEGTASAGIAAARGDNSYGGSGVAPLASLAGIRLAPHAADADEAAAFSHQLNAVHIENNSWRRPDDGQSLAAPGPLAEAALSRAIAQGRAGAGRIFVWGAGDGRASGDNCNFDGYANSRFGIAVGAVDDTGQQASYSESCSALLVSAPSSGAPGVNRSLTTTDLVGEGGDDPGDYTSGFGGTSAAAPVVSGVAALMLARNPALTWRDVQHLLVRSSRQVDASDPGWTFGAFPHSEKYGFGVVDALAAVTRAATWTSVAAEAAVPPVARAVGVTIPDNNPTGVSDSISIGSEHAGFSVEHVELEFSATHPRRGDLEVTLTSPSGVVSHLGTVRPGDAAANFTAWRFRSVRHWGEFAAGTWTLNVADRAAGSTGVFADWTLRIYGTAPPPAAPTPPPAAPTPPPAAPAPSGGGDGGSGGGAPPEPAPAPAPAPTPNSGPGAPTNLGSSVLGTTVVLSWASPASGSAPTAYILEAGSTSGASNVVVASTGGVATSYTAIGVGAGTYFVRVRAANGLGTSLPSNEIVLTVGSRSAPPSSGPSGPPSGLVASASGSSITLRWNRAAVGGSPTFYMVQAGSAPGLSDLASFSTGSTVPSFSANGVGAGTYFVRVRAGNAFGISSPSNESVLVVGGASPGPGSGACAGPPTAPNSLQFSVSGSTVTLAWNPASSGPTSYVVEAGSSSGRADLAASDTGNTATSFTANGVGAGTYFVRMRARNACGASAASNEVIVVVR